MNGDGQNCSITKNKPLEIKRITLISMCVAIVFTLEQALTFLPNIQVTVLLILVYSKVFSLKESLVIVLLHTTMDNLYMGSLNLLYFPSMVIGWALIPISVHTFLKTENPYLLGIFGIVQASVYGFLFVIPSSILLNIDVKHYILADIPFQILMAISSFVSILFLYQPLVRRLRSLIEDY